MMRSYGYTRADIAVVEALETDWQAWLAEYHEHGNDVALGVLADVTSDAMKMVQIAYSAGWLRGFHRDQVPP